MSSVWRLTDEMCRAKYVTPAFLTLSVAWGQIPVIKQVYAPDTSQPAKARNYRAATTNDRLNWFFVNTVGPASLTGGLFSAAWGTLLNSPKEFGTHWSGLGERYGMRLTGVATSNAMEAGLGALWGEDPRYVRNPGRPPGHRFLHAMKMTVLARDREGREMPAYARFIAVPGSNFLSNTWRADSEATADRALIRTGLGFLGRLSSNCFYEFWPDVRQRMFHAK